MTAPRRLIDDPDDPLHALLREAQIEPPAGARERVWHSLREEALARAGLAEPTRLFDSPSVSGALLTRAARLEPTASARARVRMRLHGRTRPATRAAVRTLLLGTAVAATAALVVTSWPPSVLRSDPVAAPPAPTVAAREWTAPANAAALVQVDGLGAMWLGPGTHASLVDDGRLELGPGRFALRADRREASRPLVVAHAGVEVRVLGTVFAIDAAETVRVYLQEGEVEVLRADRSERLIAGQWWSTAPGPIPHAPWAEQVTEALEAGVPVPPQAATAPSMRPSALRPAPVRARELGPDALLDAALGRFEHGGAADALEAADACLQGCDPQGRLLARFLKARLLQQAGDLDSARALVAEARRTPEAERVAALSFAQRAHALVRAGEHERARRMATYALALDPDAPHAAGLRWLLGEP